MVRKLAVLVGRSGFVEVGEHCRDLVEGVVVGRRCRSWLGVEVGCGSQTSGLS